MQLEGHALDQPGEVIGSSREVVDVLRFHLVGSSFSLTMDLTLGWRRRGRRDKNSPFVCVYDARCHEKERK